MLGAVVCALAPAAYAQQPKEPLPLFAADLHAATVGLPQELGWVPVVPADTKLPGRNWGFATGASAYPLRFGLITFGFGASIIHGSGSGESFTITSGSGSSATTRLTPVVHTAITSLAPQISMNFGHKLGWSYISFGAGKSKVSSSADAVGTSPEIIVPAAWNTALNFGGGAKWFMKPHLGASFDARWVKLSSRAATATLPSAKRTQLWNISAGISIQ